MTKINHKDKFRTGKIITWTTSGATSRAIILSKQGEKLFVKSPYHKDNGGWMTLDDYEEINNNEFVDKGTRTTYLGVEEVSRTNRYVWDQRWLKND